MSTKDLCVVIGGGGFVGRRLVNGLLREGDRVVRLADIGPSLKLSEDEEKGLLGESLRSGKLQYVTCDVRKPDSLISACKGATAVFHMASLSHENTDVMAHYQVSVGGTRNVISACVSAGVQRLVFTSSASVVFDGHHDIKEGDESLPYAGKPMSPYADGKAQAEALVLAGNGSECNDGGLLMTCAVRPSNIFGPGDQMTVPTIVRNAQNGRLKFIVGTGLQECDWTYVENVVEGHLCADRALAMWGRTNGAKGAVLEDDHNPSGKAFFITGGEHWRFWDFIYKLVNGFGYKAKPILKLPLPLLLPIAHAVQSLTTALAPLGVPPSDFTPERMLITARWRTFSCARAQKLLGYSPIVSMEDALQRTIDAYPELQYSEWRQQQDEAWTKSKTRAALGGGQVADLLLWKNTGLSFLALLVSLFLTSRTADAASSTPIISLLASLSLSVILLAFVLHTASVTAERFGVRLPRLPPTTPQFPERAFLAVMMPSAAVINRTYDRLVTSVVHQPDPVFVGQSIVVLLLLKFFAAMITIRVVLVSGCVGLFFIPPIIYRREDQVFAILSKWG